MNRNPEVDQWFDQADHPLDATMRHARDVILRADGRVTESIKWKTPTFAYHGNIASFNPSKHVLSIMFHRGAEIPGEHPRLEGGGQGRPHHALCRPRSARGRPSRPGGRHPRLVRLEGGLLQAGLSPGSSQASPVRPGPGAGAGRRRG
jgi:hypothetical protein